MLDAARIIHTPLEAPAHTHFRPLATSASRAARPRVVVAFDLDGTLWDVSPSIDYDDPTTILDHCTPHPRAIERVNELAKRAVFHIYLTGRSEIARRITEAQLVAYGLPPAPLIMQRQWRGYETLVHYKAAALIQWGATHHVADTTWDATASLHARIHHMHADHWRRGDPLPHLDNHEVTA